MAIARLNRPSLVIYGGTMKKGHKSIGACAGQEIDIGNALECNGEFISGKITEEERKDIIRNACPGSGSCGGMFTANTMSSAIEALGLSLPYSSSIPAESPLKVQECLRAGKAIRLLLERDIKPKDILTRKAFENAFVTIMVLGGSTNAVLHMLAMAKAADVSFTIDDVQTISDKTPFLANLRPSGKYVMEDLHDIGGVPGNDLSQCNRICIKENLLNFKKNIPIFVFRCIEISP